MHVLFLVTQWWQEKRGLQPILPLRIFKNVNNLSALGVCAADALVFNSVAYFLPLYFQVVLDRSPSTSGIYMLAIAVPLAIISFGSGYVIDRTGRYIEVLQAGLLLMTIGVGLQISFKVPQETGGIIAILFLVGVGFGPNFGAPLIALQTRIDKADIATGTATFGFVRMVSGAFGVAIGQVVVQLLMIPHLEDFIAVGIAQDVADQLAHGETISLAQNVTSLPTAQKLVVKEGMMSALRGTWVFYTGVSALGLMVSFGIKRDKLQREARCESGVVQSEAQQRIEGPCHV
jgi:MFS family permease